MFLLTKAHINVCQVKGVTHSNKLALACFGFAAWKYTVLVHSSRSH